MPERKRCSKCGEPKRLTASGRWCCDPCNRARANAYREKNIEAVRAKDRARAVAKSEYKRAKHKEWRQRNREHVRAKEREAAKRRYDMDPEKHKESARKWYRENREKALALLAAWREKNREHARAYSLLYRMAHPEQCKDANAAWKAANPEAVRRHKSKERAELRDTYVKRVLMDNRPTSGIEIPQELIDLKREQLLLRRLTRELEQEISNQLEKSNGD